MDAVAAVLRPYKPEARPKIAIGEEFTFCLTCRTHSKAVVVRPCVRLGPFAVIGGNELRFITNFIHERVYFRRVGQVPAFRAYGSRLVDGVKPPPYLALFGVVVVAAAPRRFDIQVLGHPDLVTNFHRRVPVNHGGLFVRLFLVGNREVLFRYDRFYRNLVLAGKLENDFSLAVIHRLQEADREQLVFCSKNFRGKLKDHLENIRANHGQELRPCLAKGVCETKVKHDSRAVERNFF